MIARHVRQILYWLAVVVVSLALVAALILWFDSRDHSVLRGSRHGSAHTITT